MEIKEILSKIILKNFTQNRKNSLFVSKRLLKMKSFEKLGYGEFYNALEPILNNDEEYFIFLRDYKLPIVIKDRHQLYNICINQNCNNNTTFVSDFGYKNCCSKECSYEIRNKKLRSKSIEDKKSSNELRKKTMMERYQVEYILQDPTYLNKQKQTNKEKYGEEQACKSPIFLEKRDKTVKNKYGVDYVFQDNRVKNKIRGTQEKMGRWKLLINRDDYNIYFERSAFRHGFETNNENEKKLLTEYGGF